MMLRMYKKKARIPMEKKTWTEFKESGLLWWINDSPYIRLGRSSGDRQGYQGIT